MSFKGKLFFLITLSFFIVSIGFAQVKFMRYKELEARIKKGQDTTYVINLWATWCAPCVEELPYFDKINDIYTNQKVKVILWSLDFKSKLESEVLPFVKNKRVKSEVYIVNEKSQQDFIDKISPNWSGAIPATLIIKRNQKRRDFFEKEFQYDELEKLVKSYLNN